MNSGDDVMWEVGAGRLSSAPVVIDESAHNSLFQPKINSHSRPVAVA